MEAVLRDFEFFFVAAAGLRCAVHFDGPIYSKSRRSAAP